MDSSLRMAVPATPRRTLVEHFRRRSRSRLFRANLLTGLAWASVALAVALWLADGGTAGFSTLAGSFTAQSAEVQTTSGATVTSAAYLGSLQAALDAANL